MDLTTKYLGLPLKNPIVSSASPLAQSLDDIKRLDEAGVAAIVLHSLFEEQLTAESLELHYLTTQGTDSFAEALSYFPQTEDFVLEPDEYLDHIVKAKEAVGVPIIASLNGYTTGGWVDFAQRIEKAGADALELNIYYLSTDPNIPGSDVDKNCVEVVEAVKSLLTIPVAVKLSPYFSSVANIAKKLETVKADGLVLFNRFYQPDLDLRSLEVSPTVELSTSADLRLPLRWIAILHGRINCNLAASSGIHTADDAIKAILAGADVAMMCSALYRFGLSHVRAVLSGIRQWMEEKEYESVEQMKGSMSQKSCAEPAAYERANYMKVLQSFKPMV